MDVNSMLPSTTGIGATASHLRTALCLFLLVATRPVSTNVSCQNQLRADCGGRGLGRTLCLKCAAQHQLDLHRANCSHQDIIGWCGEPGMHRSCTEKTYRNCTSSGNDCEWCRTLLSRDDHDGECCGKHASCCASNAGAGCCGGVATCCATVGGHACCEIGSSCCKPTDHSAPDSTVSCCKPGWLCCGGSTHAECCAPGYYCCANSEGCCR